LYAIIYAIIFNVKIAANTCRALSQDVPKGGYDIACLVIDPTPHPFPSTITTSLAGTSHGGLMIATTTWLMLWK